MSSVETMTCKALSKKKKRLIEFLFLVAMMFKPFVDK